MVYNLLILLLAPPFFIGVINRVKAILAGRKGPPLFQLYFDIFKLLRKGATYSSTSSYLFRIIPLTILVMALCAGCLLPIAGTSLINFGGDLILFVYLFALCRFLTITAAMDVGSSFEGMGASREATFGAFSELTTFIVLVALAVITHSLSLNQIFQWSGNHLTSEPSFILLFFAFFFILLTENSRMPIDDPNTHLELTMIHEVMILDYSGPDLGIILYGASMKLFIFMAFAVMLISPTVESGPLETAGIVLLKILFVAIVIGIIESVTARIRFIKIPQFLIASFVLSLFALLISLFTRGLV